MLGYSVKVTGKKSGKAVKKTLKATITVKNPTLTLKAANEVAVGATEQITATVKPANTKVAFTSSDDTIAKVDEKGVVTGVKAGKVTITAKAGKTTKTVDMEVKTVIFKAVKQTKVDTLEAVVAGKTSDIKASDVVITNKTTSIVNPVKSVSVDKNDATKVTIVTFAKMTDGKDYTVAIDGTTKEFTATNNTVASVSVNPTTIPYATETEISMVAKDANGVVLTDAKYGTTVPGYTFTITTSNGYTSGHALYLAKKGDTATANIVYHSGKYDENGKETGNIESGDIVITAGDQEVVTVNNFNVRVGDAGKSYDAIADNTKIAAGETKTAYFKILNSKAKEIANTDYQNYTVESSNKDVMLVNGALSATSKYVTITPVATGTAYLVVKTTKDNTVVATVAITIVDARKASSLVLDKTSATLSNTTNVSDSAKVAVTLKDQYGNDMSKKTATVKCVNVSTGADAVDTVNKNIASKYFDATTAGEVTFNGTGVTAGTYTYTVSVKADNNTTFTKTVVITVQKPEGTVSYNLVLSANTVDAVVDNTKDENIANKAVTIKVAE